MSQQLNVPYFSQLDNKFNPAGSCNVTSMAMCLYYHGIRGNGSEKQLEDQIYKRFVDLNLSRHSPHDIKTVLETYPNIGDTFTKNGTPRTIIESIERGNPVILHGYFTRFGHIIVVTGYDNTGYIVNDPYGEVFLDENGNPYYRTDLRGERLHYSYSLINRLCSPESPKNPKNFWVHSVRDKTQQIKNKERYNESRHKNKTDATEEP